jgi:hypothetical protein
MKRTLFLSVALVATLLVAVGLPAAANAAPPANDDFTAAIAVSPPSTQSVDVRDATLESGEPGGWCWPLGGSVWYQLQPSEDVVVRISTSASQYFDHTVNAYHRTGSGLGGLSAMGCAYPWSQLTLQLAAGETYYVQAGQASWASGGALGLTFEVVPPPANDDFADARSVGGLPYSDSVDATAASVEADEPTPSCGYGQSSGTVWYAFTPSVSGSYSASSPWSGFTTQLAVYTGSDLSSLSQIGCRTFGQLLTFHADVGMTYYVQVGGLWGARGAVSFSIDVAPNPIANFGRNIFDPSTYDTVQFFDFSYDPAGVGIQTWSWSFGDGGTSTGQSPIHRYASDGDYEVTLTVTTPDGRTAFDSQSIQVRTHDVSIARINVPQSATVGQTRSITVGISNQRYAENVRLDLYRSSATGFVFVGSLTQSVPVRKGGRTTDFSINYTFTSDDAALGSVNFKAIATIVDHRDALPTNNEAVALPTRVR